MNHVALLSQLKSAADFAELQASLSPVQGYLHEIEGYTLLLLAEQGGGIGRIVEIGSFMGKSTCWLATGSKRAGREKITAIDHFTGSPEHQPGQSHECAAIADEGTTFNKFQDNLSKKDLLDWVEPIVASSSDALVDWTDPIRLLFIDGDHSYEATKHDFDHWSRFVVRGGSIAFHDVGAWPGVTQFYQELLGATTDYEQALAVNSLRVLTRLTPQPAMTLIP